MTTLPTTFVVAFLLVLLAVSNRQRMNETPTGRVFALVIYLNAFSMLLIGLRWSWNLVEVLPIVAALAIASSALLYLAFRSLGRTGPVIAAARDWIHLVPVILVAVMALIQLQWVLDLLLPLTKLFYAFLLIRLVRQMPDSVQLVRLSWVKNTQQALWAAVGLTLFSLAVDIGITLDFAFYQGRHAANLVGFVSLIVLLLLGWVSVLAGHGRVSDSVNHDAASNNKPIDDAGQQPVSDKDQRQNNDATVDKPASGSEPDEAALLIVLNALLVDQQLYADTELNLQRLARKAGVPARSVSRAINSQTGLNMSQWVNSARIAAVCTLLRDSSITINEAMLQAGFLTKSNFNREFKRLKGCSPSEWRESI